MTFKYFNTPPYYDDFDQEKNYTRILFRPGHAVQARELTQMQTALQAQIDRHGRHIFKEGSPVLGGNTTLDNKLDYVKVESSFVTSAGGSTLITDNYYEEFLNTSLTGQSSGVTAKVIRDRFPDKIKEQLLATRWWNVRLDILKTLPVDNVFNFISAFQDLEGDVWDDIPTLSYK